MTWYVPSKVHLWHGMSHGNAMYGTVSVTSTLRMARRLSIKSHVWHGMHHGNPTYGTYHVSVTRSLGMARRISVNRMCDKALVTQISRRAHTPRAPITQ